MRSGERIIDLLDSVEDTKGNNGDKGILLRYYHTHSKLSVSSWWSVGVVQNVATQNL